MSLSTTVRDISAVTSNPAYDAFPGDIRNATVTFVDTDVSPNKTLCTAPIGLVSAADATIGTATCNATLSTGTYTVGIVVGGYYTATDQTVITVAQPSTKQSINGAGYLTLARSAGTNAGDAGSPAIFGFSVRYGAGNSKPKGYMDVIVNSNGHVYQIASTSLTTLGVKTASGKTTATVQGKATLIDITNPKKPITIDSNATLQIDLTDNASQPDTLGITVWNKNGGLYFSSNWNGTATVQQPLGGGSLSIQ